MVAAVGNSFSAQQSAVEAVAQHSFFVAQLLAVVVAVQPCLTFWSSAQLKAVAAVVRAAMTVMVLMTVLHSSESQCY